MGLHYIRLFIQKCVLISNDRFCYPLKVTEPPIETRKNIVTSASSFGIAVHDKIVVKNKHKRRVSQSKDEKDANPLAMIDEKKPRS